MTAITHGSILAVFFSASEAEKQEGREWYSQANQTARRLADRYDFADYSVVAGIIAALSPSNRWNRNVSDAESLIKTFRFGGALDAIKVSTYSKNKEKAIRILKGEPALEVLGGLKVKAFYRCIIGGDDVCIDGHAFSIWTGQRIPTTKTPRITPALYQQIAADYREATAVINQVTRDSLRPAQVQAITWIAWRNRFSK
jgi:hypothetical protein